MTPRSKNYTSVLERLKVTSDQVSKEPVISRMFRRIGGVRAVLEYLEGSEDPDARSLAAIMRQPGMSWDKGKDGVVLAAPFEAFCVAAGLTTPKVLTMIFLSITDQARQEELMVAAAKGPEVVERSAARALEDSIPDTKMILSHRGFLPLPRNNVTNFFGKTQISADQNQVNVSILPPVEDSVRRMSDRFNARMLGAPSPSLQDEAIDVESEEE